MPWVTPSRLRLPRACPNSPRLDLCCDAGDNGVAAIATHLPNINTLLLSECGIGDEGAGAIGARLRNLSILDLSGNDITDKGLQGY
jgi:hypothetical protein